MTRSFEELLVAELAAFDAAQLTHDELIAAGATQVSPDEYEFSIDDTDTFHELTAWPPSERPVARGNMR